MKKGLKSQTGNHKCETCGKKFRSPSHLKDHKNRKISCVIKEPSDIANKPYVCKHCNRCFTRNANLDRHYKICDVKNEKIEINPVIKCEKQIRELKQQLADQIEHHKIKDELIQKQIELTDERFLEIQKTMDKILSDTKSVDNPAHKEKTETPQSITQNIQINNVQINIISNYTQPKYDHLYDWFGEGINKQFKPNYVTAQLLDKPDELLMVLLKEIYFNPAVPENHSICHRVKTNTGYVIIDGKWKKTNLMMGGHIARVRDTLYSGVDDLYNASTVPEEIRLATLDKFNKNMNDKNIWGRELVQILEVIITNSHLITVV